MPAYERGNFNRTAFFLFVPRPGSAVQFSSRKFLFNYNNFYTQFWNLRMYSFLQCVSLFSYMLSMSVYKTAKKKKKQKQSYCDLAVIRGLWTCRYMSVHVLSHSHMVCAASWQAGWDGLEGRKLGRGTMATVPCAPGTSNAKVSLVWAPQWLAGVMVGRGNSPPPRAHPDSRCP